MMFTLLVVHFHVHINAPSTEVSSLSSLSTNHADTAAIPQA